jgi:hypothetical protein
MPSIMRILFRSGRTNYAGGRKAKFRSALDISRYTREIALPIFYDAQLSQGIKRLKCKVLTILYRNDASQAIEEVACEPY